VALVGPNGAGKTTLTRLIAGELTAREGSLKLGKKTALGYYAQHQALTLNLDATVYDEVASSAAESQVPKIRNVLGLFQFSGEDVDKPISVLSGGEKARVSLAKILLSPANFLIMDEPTNHLDMAAIEALEQALMKFEGTLLLISHDRYFLDKLVLRVFELKDGQTHEYFGNYSYYMEKREQFADILPDHLQNRDETLVEDSGHAKSMPSESSARKTKEQKRIEALARQEISLERNRLNDEILHLEEKIGREEKRKIQIERELADSAIHKKPDRIVALQKEYAILNKELEGDYPRWEAKRTQLEALLERLR
jgi:ATP-binding cassette subfamily F protein 3